jgi:1,4-dihydroxy-2-naphthoate octaprenyltransferase
MSMINNQPGLKEYVRALRLPFATASVLPFIAGSLLAKATFGIGPFILGLVSVIATHLGSNLINDYADSKSGADWQDKNFYTFFGGSKLIQEGILSQRFYLFCSILCFLLSFVCILLLAIQLKSPVILGFYFLILFLGFSYSHKPLQFSYHRLGEVIIFILFGPALVMGAYFIQIRIFPTLEGFMLSLPFGFFTTAILFANEIPDYKEDVAAKKFTWVSLVGQKRAFLIYYLLIFFGFASIVANIAFGYLSFLALLALILVFPAFRAAGILSLYWSDKLRLIESSRLTIAVHTMVSIVLVLDLLI